MVLVKKEKETLHKLHDLNMLTCVKLSNQPISRSFASYGCSARGNQFDQDINDKNKNHVMQLWQTKM